MRKSSGTRQTLAFMLLGGSTAFGCSDAAVDGARTQVTDSAGVRVITHNLDREAIAPYRLLDSPNLSIGVVDGASEYTFSRIADVEVGEGNAIFVSDAASRDIRVFDSQGVYQHSIGRAGEGPGEFGRAPTILGSAADTVFAYDSQLGRLSVFSVSGVLLRDVQVTAGNGNRISELVRQSDGSYLGQSAWISRSEVPTLHDARLELDSVVIERINRAGKVVDTLRVMADENRVRMVQDAGRGALRSIQGDPPYSPQAFLKANGGRVVIGRNDSFELEVSSADRRPIILRAEGVAHPADANRIRSHQEAVLTQAADGQPVNPATRRLYLDFLPIELPAFAAIVLSNEGDIWVALSELDDARGYDWLVFSPTGELRGSVHTTAGMRLVAVHGSYVVGVVADEFDVPSIRRYSLIAPN